MYSRRSDEHDGQLAERMMGGSTMQDVPVLIKFWFLVQQGYEGVLCML